VSRTRPGKLARLGPSAASTRAGAIRQRAAEPALDHICFAISRAYYNHLGILEHVRAETELGKHVHPGMGHILFALFAEDNLAIKDLVDRVELSYSALSGMVSRMKRAKLIACRRDAADGRSVRVRLAPLGKSLEPRAKQPFPEPPAAAEKIELIASSDHFLMIG
jgi:DNA-binding MarR family transcriptional regulator